MQMNLVFAQILKYLLHYDAVVVPQLQATKPKYLYLKEDTYSLPVQLTLSFSSCLSPRMHLWSCMTDRGTPSSVAPGPPLRRSSAWLRSGQPVSLSEHTLHRSEQPPVPPLLFLLLLCLVHLLFSPFLKTPLTPPRQPSDSSESGSLQSPRSSSPLHVKTEANQNN